MEFLTQLFTQRSILFDAALLLVVLIFAVLGARKGLVLSLCSCVAVVLALVGATMAADALTPVLAARAAPMAEGFLQEQLQSLLLSGSEALSAADGFLPHIILSVLEGQDWSPQTAALLPEFTLAVTEAILRPILFLLSFLLILLVWYFISHALDLVARLPVLSTLNAFGGFLIGAVKGILVVMVVCLLLLTFRPDLIPADILAGSRLLSLFRKAPISF